MTEPRFHNSSAPSALWYHSAAAGAFGTASISEIRGGRESIIDGRGEHSHRADASDVRLELPIQFLATLSPVFPNRGLVVHAPICGREHGSGAFDGKGYDARNGISRVTISINPPNALVVHRATGSMQLGASRKPIASARQRLDDVELHPGRMGEVRTCAGRRYSEKKEWRVVLTVVGSFGRQIW